MRAAILVLAAALAPEGDPPRFKITTKKPDDSVNVRADKDKTVFVVRSPSGISQAVIVRLDDNWPNSVVVQLHLKGLENFRVSNSKVRLDAAVSVQEGKPKVRLWKDSKEDAPLDEKSPFWANIRIVGGDGNPVGATQFLEQALHRLVDRLNDAHCRVADQVSTFPEQVFPATDKDALVRAEYQPGIGAIHLLGADDSALEGYLHGVLQHAFVAQRMVGEDRGGSRDTSSCC